MRWELISDFDNLLNANEETTPRKRLTIWEMRRQIKLTFYGREDDPFDTSKYFIWVDARDIKDLIEYLKSGMRNNTESNEEIAALIHDLEQIGGWL